MKLSRRRVLTGAGLALASGAAWLTFGGRSANAYYNGPVSDHFNGRVFFNSGHEGPKELRRVPALEPDGIERILARQLSEPACAAAAVAPDRTGRTISVRVVYVGHASFLVQAQGHNILFDPVWSERASPVSFAGPKRFNPPGIAFDDLPRIDTIVITHNHYDHLDAVTSGRLWAKFKPRIVTPLGNDAVLKKEVFSGAIHAAVGIAHRCRRLGPDDRARGRRQAACRAVAALVGARHARPPACALGELRAGNARAPALLRRRYRIWRWCALSRASGSASARSTWRCCRSAPTSRAGS